ncbi:MAG: hypothetical protein ACR2MX_11595, partial [Cyclobacteriaceae bacterium]
QIYNSILEVRRTGKLLIDSLLSKKQHRIYIDLKHSGYITRQYVYDYLDSIARNTGDIIPPICSHCAATGMEEEYYSPFVDEYALVKSKEVKKTKLYPFSINLYDEEIERICRLNGIIGLTLEQRILGGYLDPETEFKGIFGIRSRAKNPPKEKRLDKTATMRQFAQFQTFLPDFMTPSDHYKNCLEYPMKQYVTTLHDSISSISERQLKFQLYKDYNSLKPFLNNFFYMLDKTTEKNDKRDGWKYFCVGSDMDGLIDPIDIAPTVAQYPYIQDRLVQFIPTFLMETNRDPKDYYTPDIKEEDLREKVSGLFYGNLAKFVIKYFGK